MRKFFVRTLLVGGAAAAAVALVTSQASAATTVTITGANASFSASSTNTVLADTTSGQTFHCTSATASGSLGNVSHAAAPYTTVKNGGGAHSITALGFSGCSSSFGTATVTVPAADLPDDLVINSTNTVAPQAIGIVKSAGTAAPLLAHISVLTCSFNVSGSANAQWTNGTSAQLQFTGGTSPGVLHPTNISAGCFGLVGSADVISFTGTFNVTPGTIALAP
jgi:hypothetical protein